MNHDAMCESYAAQGPRLPVLPCGCADRKPCQDCGYPLTQPAGACSLCPECGTSSGCS